MADTVAILLADDQALVRRGLRMVIDGFAGKQVVAEASDGEAVFERLVEHDIDLLICDVRMPRVDGLEVLERLRRGANKLPIVLLTTFHDEATLARAAEGGANGFLLKDAEPVELAEAIDAAMRGERMLRPQATVAYREHLAQSSEPLQPQEPLSERELAVLRLISAGLGNREIATALHLAEGTVKNRVSVILQKLAVRDRSQAVFKAIRLGLI